MFCKKEYLDAKGLALVWEKICAKFLTIEDFNTEIAKYLTIEDFNTEIAKYLTIEDFNEVIANYVTNDALTEILGDYVTNEVFEDTLKRYVTHDDLSLALIDYVTNNALDIALSNYATQSWVEDYVTQQIENSTSGSVTHNDVLLLIKEALEDYATQEWVLEQIANIEVGDGGLTESQVKALIEGYDYATIDYVNEVIKDITGGGLTEDAVRKLIEEYLSGYVTQEAMEEYVADAIKGAGGGHTDEEINSLIQAYLEGHLATINGNVLYNGGDIQISGGDGGYSEEQIKEWISEAIESLKTDYNLDVTIEHANELYDLYLDRGWPTSGDGGYDDTQLKSQIIRLLTQVATDSSISYNSSTGQLTIRWAYPDEWTNSGDFGISTLTKSVTISTSSGGGDVDLTDVYNRLSTLEEHYTSLQTLVYSINDTLTEVVNNRLTEINNSISSLQGDLSSLNATVTNIDAKVTQNTGNITDIYNLVDSLQATISDLQSEQQTLKYGNASNPVVLVSGKLVRASGSSNWTFNGSMKDRITGVSISVNGGSLLVTITASYSLNVNSVQATQALSGATDITSYSIEERNYGAHWFESKVQSISVTNTVLQIREFHNGNDNNDSWVTNDTVSDGKTIREININVIGYIG